MRCESVEAEEVLDVEIFTGHLDRILVAQIQNMFHHHGPKQNPRIYVRHARLVVVQLVEVDVHNPIPRNLMGLPHPVIIRVQMLGKRGLKIHQFQLRRARIDFL